MRPFVAVYRLGHLVLLGLRLLVGLRLLGYTAVPVRSLGRRGAGHRGGRRGRSCGRCRRGRYRHAGPERDGEESESAGQRVDSPGTGDMSVTDIGEQRQCQVVESGQHGRSGLAVGRSEQRLELVRKLLAGPRGDMPAGDAVLNGRGELVGRRRDLATGGLGDSRPRRRWHPPPTTVLRGRARVFDGRPWVFGRRACAVELPLKAKTAMMATTATAAINRTRRPKPALDLSPCAGPDQWPHRLPRPARAPGSGWPYAFERRDGGTGAAVLTDVTHGWLVFLQRLRGAI